MRFWIVERYLKRKGKYFHSADVKAAPLSHVRVSVSFSCQIELQLEILNVKTQACVCGVHSVRVKKKPPRSRLQS